MSTNKKRRRLQSRSSSSSSSSTSSSSKKQKRNNNDDLTLLFAPNLFELIYLEKKPSSALLYQHITKTFIDKGKPIKFTGKVIAIQGQDDLTLAELEEDDISGDLFTILYTDGDKEDLTIAELIDDCEIVVPLPSKPSQPSQPSQPSTMSLMVASVHHDCLTLKKLRWYRYR